MQKKGNKYGTHRVIEPKGLLTQAAKKIDNNMDEIYSNEILCDVSALNIDSASFTQIYEACEKDLARTEQMILDIVNERGKMQNPVTGSGGQCPASSLRQSFFLSRHQSRSTVLPRRPYTRRRCVSVWNGTNRSATGSIPSTAFANRAK